MQFKAFPILQQHLAERQQGAWLSSAPASGASRWPHTTSAASSRVPASTGVPAKNFKKTSWIRIYRLHIPEASPGFPLSCFSDALAGCLAWPTVLAPHPACALPERWDSATKALTFRNVSTRET